MMKFYLPKPQVPGNLTDEFLLNFERTVNAYVIQVIPEIRKTGNLTIWTGVTFKERYFIEAFCLYCRTFESRDKQK